MTPAAKVAAHCSHGVIRRVRGVVHLHLFPVWGPEDSLGLSCHLSPAWPHCSCPFSSIPLLYLQISSQSIMWFKETLVLRKWWHQWLILQDFLTVKCVKYRPIVTLCGQQENCHPEWVLNFYFLAKKVKWNVKWKDVLKRFVRSGQ